MATKVEVGGIMLSIKKFIPIQPTFAAREDA
jgi:hypothetical protein